MSYLYEKIKYKKLAIIVLLVLIIFVSGLAINIFSSPGYGSLSDCEKISDAWYTSKKDSKEQCYSTIALRLRDASVCEKIDDISDRGRCMENVARYIRDPTICSKIEDSKSSGDCYFNFAMCEEISSNIVGLKDKCFIRYGMCEEISSNFGGWKDECFKRHVTK